MRKSLLTSLLLFLALATFSQQKNHQSSDNTKPWTYWWWQGSAVTKAGIKLQLEHFRMSGLGGAHIIPIYGVKGEESHFIPFLSDSWVDIFNYTTSEAKNLGLGIDLTTGTGWPFGGPQITAQYAAKQLVFNEVNQNDTLKIAELFRKSIYHRPDIFRINKDGFYKQTDKIATHNKLNLSNIKKYLIVSYEPTNQQVKRAAPRGEGLVVDHFDRTAMNKYLQLFDTTLLINRDQSAPRAFYNDSYEVYNANWTFRFFEAFRNQHGYDLKRIIYILSPNYPNATIKAKVISDYRETLSSLLYDTEQYWATWASENRILTRYQAHGSPGNLLDLYALADIPETESFGSSSFTIPNVRIDEDYTEKTFGRPNFLMMKFASSPAHLFDKKLVSSESATWLGNHFKVALSQIKPQIDELFTAGINHIFFHGTTYSPPDEPFPGWLFYASTNFGSYSHFYNELPLLNHYIANCQKLLQESEPDNDILIYLPVYDFWADTKAPLLQLFSVHHADKWLLNTPFGKLSNHLWQKGYGFDYISDLQLSKLKVNSDHHVSITGNYFKVIVIPQTTHMSIETMQNLLALSNNGATLIFDQSLPETFPGMGRNNRQSYFETLKKKLIHNPGVITGNADSILNQLNIRKETMVTSNLSFIRKRSKQGYTWFITNLSNKFSDDTITLSGNAKSLEYYNPMNDDRGFIEFKSENNQIRTKLFLPPGSSCFLISDDLPQRGKKWRFHYPSNESISISDWEVKFPVGTPFLPKNTFHPRELTSWTSWPDSTLQWFNGYGTYSAHFSLPYSWNNISGVYIRIDDLRETARTTINDKEAGTIWAVPYQLFIPKELLIFGQQNSISLNVRNLSANEARYLDKKQIYWKKFYDANIVDITYKPFDASKWSPVPSGILGKVQIIAAE